MLKVANDFLNIRGSFKVGGLVDIGTQCSLVRRANGRFVFLDSCALSGAVQRDVDALTNGGKDVEAILNLHPFHTVHSARCTNGIPRPSSKVRPGCAPKILDPGRTDFVAGPSPTCGMIVP